MKMEVSDHELTPLQIARVQDEIQDARDGAMVWTIGGIALVTIALVSLMLEWYVMADAIPGRSSLPLPMSFFGLFLFLGVACGFVVTRYRRKETRLKTLLRDRPSSDRMTD